MATPSQELASRRWFLGVSLASYTVRRSDGLQVYENCETCDSYDIMTITGMLARHGYSRNSVGQQQEVNMMQYLGKSHSCNVAELLTYLNVHYRGVNI